MLLFLLLATVVTLSAAVIITAAVIKNRIRNEYKEAAKALIMKKNVTTVHVGIYDVHNNKIKEMEIRSSKGVDEDVFEGQTINIKQ